MWPNLPKSMVYCYYLLSISIVIVINYQKRIYFASQFEAYIMAGKSWWQVCELVGNMVEEAKEDSGMNTSIPARAPPWSAHFLDIQCTTLAQNHTFVCHVCH